MGKVKVPEELPPGWEAREVDGRVVYINHDKRTTHWDPPKWTKADREAAKKKAQAAKEQSKAKGASVPVSQPLGSALASQQEARTELLPEGWDCKVIDGRKIYIDHVNKKTTETKPIMRAADMAEAPATRTSLSSDKSLDQRGRQNSSESRSSSMSKTQAAELPLPRGWSQANTPAGEVYYVNHSTKTTTWTRPNWTDTDYSDERSGDRGSAVRESVSGRESKNSFALQAVSEGEETEPPLPPGWEARMSAENKIFYINHINKTTSWDRPVMPRSCANTQRFLPTAATASGSTNIHSKSSSAPAHTKELSSGGGPVGVHSSLGLSSQGSGGGIIARERAIGEGVKGSIDEFGHGSGDGVNTHGEGLGTSGSPVSDILRSQKLGQTVRPSSGFADSEATRGPSAAGVGSAANVNGGAEAPNSRSVPTESTSATDGALPLGWTELRTKEGKVYYQNSILKTTQWDRPTETGAATTTPSSSSNSTNNKKDNTDDSKNDSLSSGGWEKVVTPDGRPYYQHSGTHQTSWTRPTDYDAGMATEDSAIARPSSFFTSKPNNQALTGAADEKGALAGSGSEGNSAHTSGGSDARKDSSISSKGERQAAPPIARPVSCDSETENAFVTEAADASLPPGWEKLYTQDGVPFYTNHIDKTTSWDPPPSLSVGPAFAEAAPVIHTPTGSSFKSITHDGVATPIAVSMARRIASKPISSPPVEDIPLPPGWEKLTNEQGVPYYVDHINKQTSWDPPPQPGSDSIVSGGINALPAQLVPDSIDLYVGADVLNRVFGHCGGNGSKSPLEVARDIIVEELTGPGLKATKSRNGTSLARHLYLSPTNTQMVWSSKASTKGKLSRKGVKLEMVTGLLYEKSSLKIDLTGETASLFLACNAVSMLTAEEATILLGVLLSDMTGKAFEFDGEGGAGRNSYYPAVFVNEVLRVREERQANTQASVQETSGDDSHPEQQSTTNSEVADVLNVNDEVEGPADVANRAEARESVIDEPSKTEDAESPVVHDTSSGHRSPRSPRVMPGEESGAGDEFASSVDSECDGTTTKSVYRDHDDSDERASSVTEQRGAMSPAPVPLYGNSPTVDLADTPEELEADMKDLRDEGSGDEPTAVANKPLKAEEIVAVSPRPASATSVPNDETGTAAESEKEDEASEDRDLATQLGQSEGEAPRGSNDESHNDDQVEVERGAACDANEEDQETATYRAVLLEMLEPVKMQHLVDNFLRSGVTLDILPLVERSDLASEVGITEAIPQLKIMKQIKKRWPDGI